jgi:diguanylate cyclase (GGDEF)-like protein
VAWLSATWTAIRGSVERPVIAGSAAPATFMSGGDTMQSPLSCTDSRPGECALGRWQQYAAIKGRFSVAGWMLVALLLVAVIALLDLTGGPEIHLFVFYLLPVLLTTWCLGLRAGLCLCGLCVVASMGGGWRDGAALGADDYVTALARLLMFTLAAVGWWELGQMSAALAELSLIDPLTGLSNRRACILRGEAELSRMRRNGECLSLMFIDLDNFKEVNDRHGHKAGDRLLSAMAAKLLDLLRKSDLAARLGGDEFAVILPATNGASSVLVAETILDQLGKLMGEHRVVVTASIGIATYRCAPARFEDALQAADELMYQIKKSGKRGVLQRDVLGAS